MSNYIAEAQVAIRGDSSKLNKDVEGGIGGIGPLGADAGKKIAAGIGAGMIAGGVAFAGFDQQMREVFTLMPGISGDAMGKMNSQVLDFSKEFGRLPGDVIPALYDSLSAGVPADNVFSFLETSQKFAAAGATDVGTAVDGLSTVVNAFGLDAGQAGDAADSMFTAVKLGKCVVGSTRVLLADGRYERIDSLYDGVEVVSWDGRGFTPRRARWVDQGTKQTRIVATRLGRTIETTPEHPYLSLKAGEDLYRSTVQPQWRRVDELAPGDRIAVPTHLPYFGHVEAAEHESSMLGLWLAEGASDLSGGVRITSTDYGDEIKRWAAEYGLVAETNERRPGKAPTWCVKSPLGRSARSNPLTDRLRALGLGECTAATKHVPAEVFSWDVSSVANVVRWLFNGDGWLAAGDDPRRAGGKAYQLGFCSKSERLVRDVSHLLLRFGVVGKVRKLKTNAWAWETGRHQEITRFLDLIGIDRESVESFRAVEPVKGRAARYGQVEFDPIDSIEVGGDERVYDLCVPGLRNFVAEDIVAHNTTVAELSGAMFQVAPIAANLGVSVDEVSAGFASLTAQGVPTSVAATQMKSAFAELAKTGSVADKAFRDVAGVGFADFIAGGGDVQGAFNMMRDAADQAGVPVTDMFGSIEAGSAVLGLTGANAERFGANLEAMGTKAGATNAAFEVMDQGIMPAFNRMKATVVAGFIELGAAIAPGIEVVFNGIVAILPRVSEAFRAGLALIGPIVAAIAPALIGLATAIGGVVAAIGGAVVAFIGWLDSSGMLVPVIAGLGTAVAALLLPALISMGVAVWAAVPGVLAYAASWLAAAAGVIAANAPIVAAAVAIAALVAGLVWAYQNVDWFRAAVDRVVGVITGTLWPILQQVAAYLAGVFATAWSAVAGFVTGTFLPAMIQVGGFLTGTVWPILQQVGAFLAGAFAAAWTVVSAVVGAVVPILAAVAQFIGGVLWGALQLVAGFLTGTFSVAWTVISTVVGGVITVFGGIVNFVTGTLVPAFMGFVGFITGTLVPGVAGIGDAIGGGFTAVLGVVTGVIDAIKNVVITAFEFIKARVVEVLAAMGIDAGAAWQMISTVATTVLGALQTAVGAAMTFIQSVFSVGWAVVSAVVGAAMTAITAVVSAGWNAISAVVGGVMGVIQAVIGTAWNVISAVVGAAMTAIHAVVSAGWNVLSTVIGAAMGVIQAVVTTAWGVISTVIGTVLGAISTAIQTYWSAYLAIITAVSGVIQAVVTTAWTAISTVVSTVMAVIQAVVTTAWTVISAVIGAAMTAIQAVVTTAWAAISAAISAAMATIQAVVTTAWAAISAAIGAAMAAIQAVVAAAWAAISAAISAAMATIQAVVTAAWAAISAAIGAAMAAIQAVVAAAWAAISALIGTAMATIQAVVTAAWAAISAAISAAMAAIQAVVTAAWNAISALISAAMATIQAVVMAAWNAISAAISAAMATIQGVVTAAWNAISAAISAAMATIQGVVIGAWNAIRAAISTAMATIQGVITTAWNAVTAAIRTAMAAAQSAVSMAFNAMVGVVRTVTGTIRDTVTTAFGAIKGAVEGPINSARDTVVSGFRAMTGPIDAVSAAIDKMIGWVKKIPTSIKLPTVPGAGAISGAIGGVAARFSADGRFVDRPMLSWLGEGYRPELVLPLTKPGRMAELLSSPKATGVRNIAAGLNGGGGGTVNSSSTTVAPTYHFYGVDLGTAMKRARRDERRRTSALLGSV